MADTDDLTALLHSLYDSFASGDAAAWVDRLADDVLCIGTDEAEWWEGKAGTVPILEAQLSEMSAAGISVSAGTPVVGTAGDVGWIGDQPTLHLPDGSHHSLRATLVATREAEGWMIRQAHLSAPAPNEEVVQQPLTVS